MTWRTAALGEIAPAKPLRKVDVTEDTPVWQLTLDQIESDTGLLIEKNVQPRREAGSSTHWFNEHHVLYSKLRPYLNKVLLPEELGLSTTELIPLYPSPDILERKYLAYYLRSKRFVNWISGQTAGAKMPRVSMKVFWEHKIPLPPLTEQKSIATILDKADAIRRKRQLAIQLADEFLRAVFLDMFGDPVINPKGWDVSCIGDLTTKIGSGATPRGGKSAYIEKGISLIRSLNVHDNKFIYGNLAHISDDQANALSNVTVEEDDVLLNITGASVCRCTIVPNDVLPARVNQHVCIIRPDTNKLISRYLLHLLISKTYKQKLLSIAGAGGATREALTKQQVEDLTIPLPPVDLQKQFSEIVKKINYTTSVCNEQLSFPIFQALSQRAFQGEL